LVKTSWQIAVIGAGPAGLALALQAARLLPTARISVFDARPIDKDLTTDPRTLALALGSVQLLRRLGVWPAEAAQSIAEVSVSQAPPTLQSAWLPGELRITAAQEGVEMLGAVIAYGALLAPLQAAWVAAVEREPQRLVSRFGQPVTALKDVDGGVEVDAGIVERFDLAVVAEGGVFAEQARKSIVRDYAQTAWIGRATLAGAAAATAFERFTRAGPVALLPLKPVLDATHESARNGAAARTSTETLSQAALVWCVDANDDPVADLTDPQRLAVLSSLLPEQAGRLVALSPLKSFPLGLNAETRLVAGRQVRIGNAAQTLHPVAGQGLNLGLRDAFELVDALRNATDLDRALRRLDWTRAADRWTMIAATDLLARGFTWAWPGLPAARGLGLAAMQLLPGLRSGLARRMMFGVR
jgi:2-octaprenyl-6-methoxyphenol hydroxylase